MLHPHLTVFAVLVIKHVGQLTEFACSFTIRGLAMVSYVKLAKVDTKGKELPLTKVLLPIEPSVPHSDLSTEKIQKALEEASVVRPDSVIDFYYKDADGDLILIINRHAPWPVGADTDGIIKGWFLCAPPRPQENFTVVCMGPHTHQPPDKKARSLNLEQFHGYSLLEAASAGCDKCVNHWLQKGVDVNFSSTNKGYTAMDFILWSKDEGKVTVSMAATVVSTLQAQGGRAHIMA